jgi:hypothetical protein
VSHLTAFKVHHVLIYLFSVSHFVSYIQAQTCTSPYLAFLFEPSRKNVHKTVVNKMGSTFGPPSPSISEETMKQPISSQQEFQLAESNGQSHNHLLSFHRTDVADAVPSLCLQSNFANQTVDENHFFKVPELSQNVFTLEFQQAVFQIVLGLINQVCLKVVPQCLQSPCSKGRVRICHRIHNSQVQRLVLKTWTYKVMYTKCAFVPCQVYA